MKTARTTLIIFWFFSAIFSGFSHADSAKFENGFLQIRPSIEREFDIAETLVPEAFSGYLGTPLSQKACTRVFQNAATWYPRDPFAFQFTGGTARIPICGGPSGRAQNFIEYRFGDIGIDQQYLKIISYRDPMLVYENIRRFYFDYSDHLVAIVNYEVMTGQTQIQSFIYQTEDRQGNQYHREWQANALESVTGIRGPYSSVHVIPRKSLKIFTQSLRNRWTDAKNTKITRETRMISQVLAKDWEEYFAPMPQNWFSAFFKYAGRWYSSPNNWSQIFIKSQNGADICFIGTVFRTVKRLKTTQTLRQISMPA